MLNGFADLSAKRSIFAYNRNKTRIEIEDKYKIPFIHACIRVLSYFALANSTWKYKTVLGLDLNILYHKH